MSTPEVREKIDELLARVFELKQAIDAMVNAPAEVVDRMARVDKAAKTLEAAL